MWITNVIYSKRKHEDTDFCPALFLHDAGSKHVVYRLRRRLGVRQTERTPEELVTDRVGIIDRVAPGDPARFEPRW